MTNKVGDSLNYLLSKFSDDTGQRKHIYCTKNGHHKRCYFYFDEWLCPICDYTKLYGTRTLMCWKDIASLPPNGRYHIVMEDDMQGCTIEDNKRNQVAFLWKKTFTKDGWYDATLLLRKYGWNVRIEVKDEE